MGTRGGLKAENAAVEMFPVPFWSPPGGGNGVEKRRNAASGVPGGGFGAAKNRVWAGILRASDGKTGLPTGKSQEKAKKNEKRFAESRIRVTKRGRTKQCDQRSDKTVASEKFTRGYFFPLKQVFFAGFGFG